MQWIALIVGAKLGDAEPREGAPTISLRRELCFPAYPGSIDSLAAFAWRSKSRKTLGEIVRNGSAGHVVLQTAVGQEEAVSVCIA